MPESTPDARFPTTNWGRVAAAGDPDGDGRGPRAALAELCAAYWYPIYALIRRRGHDPDNALDLTQEFFARLLERGTIAAADRARGRFRGLLAADCTFFLADRRDRDGAAKRGGRVAILSIDAADAEARYRLEPIDGLTPERLFDRAWALSLLDTVLSRLRGEYEIDGKGELFERLRSYLAGDADAPTYKAMAESLGSTEAAVEAAARRLRRRFRDALRQAIAATLDEGGDPDEEIRDLFAALRG